MRSSLPGQARGAIYDRNPLSILTANIFNQAIGPHTITTRFTYTVPANRKAMVQGRSGIINRITAAAPVGEVLIRENYNGTNVPIVASLLNGVGDLKQSDLGAGPILLAGDVLQGMTVDPSTGGTVTYYARWHIIEFDV